MRAGRFRADLLASAAARAPRGCPPHVLAAAGSARSRAASCD
jgi:hypothetical protein